MAKIIRCAAILLLLCPPALWAGINIPVDCRVKNRPPGRCGWCALETLARYHHVAPLYGLTEDHPYLASPDSLEAAVDEAGIEYEIQYPGSWSRGILRRAVKNGLGAVVGVHGGYNGRGPHILTLVDYGPKGVKVIDSNDRDVAIKEMSLDDFLSWWDGFAIVLVPPPAQAKAANQVGVAAEAK